jgi:competence protein ComEA
MKQAGYILIGLFLGLIMAGALMLVTGLPGGTPVKLEEPPTQVPIEVHVIGAILRPGLYRFAEGSRVQDAITAAGGLSSEADVTTLNLAAKLEDGEQLTIPFPGGAAPTKLSTPGFQVLPGAGTPTPRAGLVNINTASAAVLSSLPGIGPTIAQRIVDYRTAHGPFAHVQDIMNVPGIGPATFDNIRNAITVQ